MERTHDGQQGLFLRTVKGIEHGVHKFGLSEQVGRRDPSESEDEGSNLGLPPVTPLTLQTTLTPRGGPGLEGGR